VISWVGLILDMKPRRPSTRTKEMHGKLLLGTRLVNIKDETDNGET
jgi:hypothetical protein